LMPYLRHTIIAALWGVPGPALTGCVIVFVWTWSSTWWDADGSPHMLTILDSLAAGWPLLVFEVVNGLAYGAIRCGYVADGNRRRVDLRDGIELGGTAWLVLSAPLLACTSSGLIFATVALHAYGGAIAGLHVEYYLLRGEQPCEG
jgi:hypothetical protein